ncbi:3'-5' exonuclease [Neisseria sp. Ec49-e6-T10]|uniref:3'-5' exonuclease n=1 Tax=Neisseria sp. Ec49-e6-T10 TaxID=3140744 RepID=UPI003EB82C8A
MSVPNQILAGLNEQQLVAVTWPHQSALILAGAGSGKTRVLTTRIAWLMQTSQTSAHAIMAVTFTNKAAREMQVRLSTMVPFNTKQMWLGTFHGLCHRFLRLHAKEANLPNTFQIIDSQDQLAIIKRLLKQHQISDAQIAPKSLQGFIGAQKEAGLRANQLEGKDSYQKKLIELFAAYDAYCQQEGLVDFAELLLRSFEALKQNKALRAHYQNRFSNILIDEFQDTSQLQYAWLKLLSGEQTVLFAVGDDDQSIYAFRGAHVGNMHSLMREFDIEEPIKLEQNYRSMGYILTAANAVIEQNPERLGKNLWTDAGDGEALRFYHATTDMDEAQFVLDEVKNLHREGTALRQMAILYRSNAQSRILEQVFFKAGVPYKIYGGLRFFERQEVKHALAYLRLLINPDDSSSFLRVINVPARGIGARTIEQIQDVAVEHGVSLWQAAKQIVSGKVSIKIKGFIELIEALSEQAQTLTLPSLIEKVVADSGLYQMYEEDKKDGVDRLENLEELVSAAAQFQHEDESITPLLEFLAAAALESGEHQAAAGEDALQLMTIHSAKGLEFDVVFLTGLEEGLFPSEMSLAERKGIEEERRLMYVAITRAKQRLYLSASQVRMLYGKQHFSLTSRFLDEIPEGVIKFITPKTVHSSVPSDLLSKKQPKELLISHNQTYAGFCIGENVRHAKFGLGVVIDAKGNEQEAHLHINFGKEGMKWLDTKYAKLDKT